MHIHLAAAGKLALLAEQTPAARPAARRVLARPAIKRLWRACGALESGRWVAELAAGGAEAGFCVTCAFPLPNAALACAALLEAWVAAGPAAAPGAAARAGAGGGGPRGVAPSAAEAAAARAEADAAAAALLGEPAMLEAMRGYCWMVAASARLHARSAEDPEERMGSLMRFFPALRCPLLAPFRPWLGAQLVAAVAEALRGAPPDAATCACELFPALSGLLRPARAARGGGARGALPRPANLQDFLAGAGALAGAGSAAFAAALGEPRLVALTARAGAAWSPPPPPWEPPAVRAPPPAPRALGRAVVVALAALLKAAPRLGGAADPDHVWNASQRLGGALRTTLAALVDRSATAGAAAGAGTGSGAAANADADADADAAAAVAELLAARARADAAGGAADARPYHAGQEILLDCLALAGAWADPPNGGAAPRYAPRRRTRRRPRTSNKGCVLSIFFIFIF